MAASSAIRGGPHAPARPTSSTWDLLVALTTRNLRVRYHGTVLSYVWWVARPLALGLVLYFALGRVLKLSVPHHAIFLLSALFPWFWFQGALQACAGSFIGNGGLLKKVRFPREIIPISVVLETGVEFVATLPILAIFVFANKISPSWTWIVGIPFLVVLQMLLLIGLGTLAACLTVFFRDLAPSIEVLLTLLFYMSPVIYPLDKVPANIRPLLRLNPLASLLEAWRGIFLDGSLPGLDLWPCVLVTALALALGYLALRMVGDQMVDAL